MPATRLSVVPTTKVRPRSRPYEPSTGTLHLASIEPADHACRHARGQALVRQAKRMVWFLLLTLSVAAQPAQTIRQMVHTTWTGHNGAPQGITALAQTPDGRLWIGTFAGLYSFDGYSFRSFPLPTLSGAPVLSHKVQSLLVSHEGGLWVIGQGSGAVYIQNGVSQDAGQFEGRHVRFDSLQETSAGRTWAVLDDHSLAWCDRDHIWHLTPGPVPRPVLVSGIFFDAQDTLWAVVDDHLYRRAATSTTFTDTGIIAEGGIHFAQSADQTLWLVGQMPKRYKGEIRGIDLRHMDLAGHALTLPFVHSDVNAMLVSRSGALWVLENDIGTYGERSPGLTRHSWQANHWENDHLVSAHGLGNSDSHAMIEDADGSIWIGGERQLERFRPSTLVPLEPGLVGSSWILCTNAHGGLWVGSRSGLLMHVSNGRQVPVHGQDGPYKLECRNDDSAWMLDARGLSLVHGTSVDRLPLLSGHGSYLDNWGFSDVLETKNHRLIVAEHGASESRLWQLERGRWRPFSPELNGIPIHASFERATGEILFGGPDDALFSVQGQQSRRVPVIGGLLGTISAFQQTTAGVFALGGEGIAVYRAGAFRRLLFATPENAEMVSGMVQAPAGDTWLNGRNGIVHVAAVEMQAALDDPNHRIVSSELHEGDFVGPSISGITSSSAVKDDRGVLWFATLNGIVSFAQSVSKFPVRPPVLHIEAADADGRSFSDRALLPPHISTVRIRYLGLNLTRPDDVVYSYQMQGLDKGWQSVGQRTEAVYTGLKPTGYHFLVKASYGDGSWTSPVELSFQVLPMFYQTLWFKVLCTLGCLLLVTIFLWLRLRTLSRTIQERAEQRADERIRIARDLHDTLLQSMQGLLMSFHVAAQSVPAESNPRALLERALQSADRLLVEGRNRVSSLRGESPTEHADLLTSLTHIGQEMGAGNPTIFRATGDGEPFPLRTAVRDELFFVGREALTNAYRHSGATRIELTLRHGSTNFTMICQDNGLGIRADPASLCGRHWGIVGMVERIERIGGTCRIESQPDTGTKVIVSIPARKMYVDPPQSGVWRFVKVRSSKGTGGMR